MPVEGDLTPRPALGPEGSLGVRNPVLSRDGEWIAYVKKVSGLDGVYVRPFPEGGSEVLVSEGDAVEPVWGRDSRELFYRDEMNMVAVELQTSPQLRVVSREVLFPSRHYFQYLNTGWGVYDYDRRTDRFLMSREVNHYDPPAEIQVIKNFFNVLNRKAPRKR